MKTSPHTPYGPSGFIRLAFLCLLLGGSAFSQDISVDVNSYGSVDIQNNSGNTWYFFQGPSPSGASMAKEDSELLQAIPWGTVGQFAPDPNSLVQDRLWTGMYLRIYANSVSAGTVITVAYATNPAPDAVVFTISATVINSAQVVSISPLDANPVAGPGTLDWAVTFSQPVSDVTTNNFDLSNPTRIPGTAITGVSGSGANWTVTATTSGSAQGILGCNYRGHASESPEVAAPFTGDPYSFEEVPVVTVNPRDGGPFTNGSSYTMTAEGKMPGGGDVDYQWYENGNQIPGARTSTTPSTDSTYTTGRLGPGTYQFYCQVMAVVDNGLYTDTSVATVVVMPAVPPGPPVINSPTYGGLNFTSGQLGGNVASDLGVPITKRGVVFAPTSTNPTLTIGAPGVTEVDDTTAATGGFSVNVPLTVNTAYSFVAFAVNSLGTSYTPVTTFATVFTPPTVIAASAYGATETNALLGATVSDDGNTPITRRGILYATTAANLPLTLGTPKVTEVDASYPDVGWFEVSIAGLSPATNYSFVGFAANIVGTNYSPITTFATAELPSLDVNTLGDAVNPFDQVTSLREAIAYAASLPGDQTITFDPTVFGTAQTITLDVNEGELTLLKQNGVLNIIGPGAKLLSINGGGTVRVFHAFHPANLSGLTITGGSAADGGGIANDGELLTLTDCTISGNSGVSGDGNGGGVYTQSGTTLLTGCTISGNSSSERGGGLYSYQGTLTLENCTVISNSAGAFASGCQGGGLYSYEATLTLSNCTVSTNYADSAGGLYEYPYQGSVTLANTIVAGNASRLYGPNPIAPDVYATVTSGGYNLIGEVDSFGSGWIGSDLTGTVAQPLAPLLANLGDYGGPTPTAPPLPGSPAIGAVPANNLGILATDQRGVTRNLAAATDIGAVQTQGYTLTGIGGSPQTVLAGAAFPNLLSVALSPNNTNDPVAGAVITFTAPAAGASAILSAATVVATNGFALESATANTTPGGYTVVATVSGGAPVSFLLTNVDPTLIPIVASPTVTHVAPASGTLGGDVTSDGGLGIIKRGVLFAPTTINPNPTIGGLGVTEVDDTNASMGTFTEKVAGLSPQTGYTFVAFAVNSVWTTYTTPVSTFTTEPAPPTVATLPASPVSPTGATLNGSVNPNGPTATLSFQLSTNASFIPIVQTTIVSGLGRPTGLALDAAGDLFIANADSGIIEKVLPAGAMTNIGSGFNQPYGVAVDAYGNVFVADSGNNVVKEIWPDGSVTGIGSGFSNPNGVAVDAEGDVFVADTGNNAIKEVLPDGSVTQVGSGFNQPYGVAVDAVGNVYVADTYHQLVKKVFPDGAITNLASGFNAVTGVAVDAAGDVFAADHGANTVEEILPDGTILPIGSGWNQPAGLVVNAAGNLYVADSDNGRVVRLTPLTITATPSSLNGTTTVPFSTALTGLTPDATYYYRAAASGPGGTVAGSTLSFQAIEAPSLVVTTTNDTANPGDGVTSLREALTYAQTLSGPQTVTFAPGLAGQTLILTNGWSGTNDTSALQIFIAVTVQGLTNSPGVTLAIGTGVPRRHFLVNGSASLTLANLTLRNGFASDYGGSVWSFGSLTVSNCTFTGNYAGQEGGAIQAWGGESPFLLVQNSTIAGNTSAGIASAISDGSVQTIFDHVTMVDNVAAATGAALWLYNTVATMTNCIIARNTYDGVQTYGTGAFSAPSANNLVGVGNWAGLANGVNGNLVGLAPASLSLGTLANNGGPTPTVALLAGSPAINAGTGADGVTTDQRGTLRMQFGVVDIGAYEQSLASQPPVLRNLTRQANGTLQFTFTNLPGASFTVLTSTNLALPLSKWTSLGAPVENPAGQYQFTDPQATGTGKRFYRVQSP